MSAAANNALALGGASKAAGCSGGGAAVGVPVLRVVAPRVPPGGTVCSRVGSFRVGDPSGRVHNVQAKVCNRQGQFVLCVKEGNKIMCRTPQLNSPAMGVVAVGHRMGVW
eukprot:TRINITY_DN22967_c0_g1_i1.p2 TRINITY_DN22967_c0_g1~~TRINITY_DN22967_c0_g1_i1.p2  ORF type:complete len:110 (+),score=21.81 TRINITY_DN22967_c0_g1_i1:84-413(+)